MTRSAFAGCIVGLAVGDALGYPHEFRTVKQVQKEIAPEGITGFLRLQDERFTRPWIVGTDHPPGTFTDDTQMSIAVAEAMLDAGRAGLSDRDALMSAMARRFVQWFDSDKNDRSPGETTGIACKRLREGASWREAGVVESKGCGANMRVAPIGLVVAKDLEQCADIARDCARITHAHPAALEGAAAAALLVALAHRSPAEMHAEVTRLCGGRSPDFDEIFAKVPHVLDAPADQVLVARGSTPEALGEGWVAEEAIASALWCVWRHPDDYRAAVLRAVNTDGDSDSIATMAGSISGARLGLDAIPAEWRRDVEDSAYLHALASRLETLVT
jgi:ADP-ribosylglycohydrolase